MSRGIPKVRTWNVTIVEVGGRVIRLEIDTINKRFARWLAIPRAGYPTWTKITVSLKQKEHNHVD